MTVTDCQRKTFLLTVNKFLKLQKGFQIFAENTIKS